MQPLVFLKLGGSLITDKTRPYTARLEVLATLAKQLAAVRTRTPGLRLLLGHGSGSFGHTAARRHQTRRGVVTPKDWRGFSEVWHQASTLNRHVMQALHESSISAMAFPPSGTVTATDGKDLAYDSTPIERALAVGILPVVYGDVVFDQVRGGTILSTEDLFIHLAARLLPQRILLAGREQALWADFPERKHPIRTLTRDSFEQISQGIGESEGYDVTGGMGSKVRQMLALVQTHPELEIQIFSGEQPGNVERALNGEVIGTVIKN